MNLILPSAGRKGREKQEGLLEDSWGFSHLCALLARRDALFSPVSSPPPPRCPLTAPPPSAHGNCSSFAPGPFALPYHKSGELAPAVSCSLSLAVAGHLKNPCGFHSGILSPSLGLISSFHESAHGWVQVVTKTGLGDTDPWLNERQCLRELSRCWFKTVGLISQPCRLPPL